MDEDTAYCEIVERAFSTSNGFRVQCDSRERAIRLRFLFNQWRRRQRESQGLVPSMLEKIERIRVSVSGNTVVFHAGVVPSEVFTALGKEGG